MSRPGCAGSRCIASARASASTAALPRRPLENAASSPLARTTAPGGGRRDAWRSSKSGLALPGLSFGWSYMSRITRSQPLVARTAIASRAAAGERADERGERHARGPAADRLGEAFDGERRVGLEARVARLAGAPRRLEQRVGAGELGHHAPGIAAHPGSPALSRTSRRISEIEITGSTRMNK